MGIAGPVMPEDADQYGLERTRTSMAWSCRAMKAFSASTTKAMATGAPASPAQAPRTGEERGVQHRLLPPYKVILHNDDHTPMDRVVMALRKSIPGMSLGRATAIMWEA